MLRVAALVALLMVAFPLRAAAADIRQGNDIVIGANDTVDDDLYAFGNSIAINGTVNGDVVGAGQSLSVDGTVNGNVIFAGSSVSIRGQVTGSVRAAGGTVFIDGKVGTDVVAASREITVSASGSIGRDAIVAGDTVTLGGDVKRNVQAASRNLTIDGHVGGSVTAQDETLRLTGRAVIDGSLTYTSASDAQLSSGAVIKGPTQRRTPEQGPVPAANGPLALAIDWLRGLVGLLLLGLFIVLIFPHFSRRAGEAFVRAPLVSLGLGLLVLILVPILAGVIFVLGALVGGWWLGLVVLAFYFTAIAVSVPVAALGLGGSILRITQRPVHLVIALIVGLIVLLLVALVPYLGPVVIVLAVLFGLGATTMAIPAGRHAEPTPA